MLCKWLCWVMNLLSRGDCEAPTAEPISLLALLFPWLSALRCTTALSQSYARYCSRQTCKIGTWRLWSFRGLQLSFTLYVYPSMLTCASKPCWPTTGIGVGSWFVFLPFFPIPYRSSVNLTWYFHLIVPQRFILPSEIKYGILFQLHLIWVPSIKQGTADSAAPEHFMNTFSLFLQVCPSDAGRFFWLFFPLSNPKLL